MLSAKNRYYYYLATGRVGRRWLKYLCRPLSLYPDSAFANFPFSLPYSSYLWAVWSLLLIFPTPPQTSHYLKLHIRVVSNVIFLHDPPNTSCSPVQLTLLFWNYGFLLLYVISNFPRKGFLVALQSLPERFFFVPILYVDLVLFFLLYPIGSLSFPKQIGLSMLCPARPDGGPAAKEFWTGSRRRLNPRQGQQVQQERDHPTSSSHAPPTAGRSTRIGEVTNHSSVVLTPLNCMLRGVLLFSLKLD